MGTSGIGGPTLNETVLSGMSVTVDADDCKDQPEDGTILRRPFLRNQPSHTNEDNRLED